MSKYLRNSFDSLHLKLEYKNTIQALMLESCYKITEQVRSQFLHNRPLKLSKSKEIKRNTIEDSQNTFAGIPRKVFLQQFKEKAEENKLFALKHIKKQNELLRRKQERDEETIKRLSIQEEEDAKQRERMLQEQDLLKRKNKLQDLQENSEKRKNEINYYQEKIRSKRISNSATPLFKQIEENFYYKVQMPELERRKNELQRKRELYKPISHNDLLEHARRIESLRSELRQKRKKAAGMRSFEEKIHSACNNMKSKFTEAVLEEERKLREEELQKEQERKKLNEKKKHYSDVVNEMFQPSIDRFKQQEMKLIKAKLQFPVKLKSSICNTVQDKTSDYSRSVSIQPKKWKKNNMIPEEPEQRVGKKIFYLEERRKLREKSERLNREILNWEENLEWSSNNEDKNKALRHRADKLELAAKRYEMKLDGKQLDIEVADHVNDLIINSIRAKLEILKN